MDHDLLIARLGKNSSQEDIIYAFHEKLFNENTLTSSCQKYV